MCPTCPSTGSPHVEHYEVIHNRLDTYRSYLDPGNEREYSIGGLFLISKALLKDVEFLLTEIEENK